MQKLQEYFIQYLDYLEIKPEIARFIRYLGINSEKREYLKWLSDIMKFIIK